MRDDVFAALANPTRRALLDLLREGPRSAGELAEQFAMTRPSVSEHLRVLRELGLVDERRDGRRRIYELDARPLREVGTWLHPFEQFWRDRLGELGNVLDQQAIAANPTTASTREPRRR